MSAPDENLSVSVTQWMQDAVRGDEVAQVKLWTRYFDRLLRVARGRLAYGSRRVADEEDVVLEAFNAFFNGCNPSQLEDKANREDLWRILVRITERKAVDQMRREHRQKRGGGKVLGHSFGGTKEDGFQQIPDPTPEFADEFSLTCEHLLHVLTDDQRFVALRKLAGHTNREIAEEVGCVEESIRRKVILIRKVWSDNESHL